MASMERVTVGALSFLAGTFWLVMNLSTDSATDVGIGAVVAAGGLALLAWHRLGVPARLARIVAAVTGLAGAVVGLASHSASLGGMYAWSEDRGWPFAWLYRGAVADDPGQARLLAEADGWGIDVLRLVADLVVWAYAGLIVAVVIGRFLRGKDRTGEILDS
ncbi:hypothetical protein [Actinoplanes aureus]|uniref:Uncharacterized protein n=1 Tax=Actinoplanes aureus TaxID=2792083 RepID=A0A931C600_9ACTN|nr:hypothetical protein [Actinoplanes aureus]MBG0561666.1 hypothetical protein [Actinoplanes aureus]